MQYIDILILTEIRLDDAFPKCNSKWLFFRTVQFLVSVFSEPYKLDRNRNREEVLIYIRENILS